MQIQEIYDKYEILPNLQLHMLRVAGVAFLICDNFNKSIDKNAIISACLLHDMGNIVKFNFDNFDDGWFPKGKEHWIKIKKRYIKKYGNDDHTATINTIKEVGVFTKIVKLINDIGFSESKKIFDSSNYNLKILSYADQRVAPNAVTSMDERYSEARIRYASIIRGKYTPKQFDFLVTQNYLNEKQIFTHCKIMSEDITEEKVQPLLANLRHFDIQIKY